MIHSKLQKSGDDFVVVIPSEVVAKLQLEDGQSVMVQLRPTDENGLDQDLLHELFEQSWQANEAGYRYLAGR